MAFGAVMQLIHFFLVPETRTTILLDREAKRRRARGQEEVYGPNELDKDRLTFRDVLKIWFRVSKLLI